MRKKKVVIVSPRQKGGGAVVLHTLCKNLCDLGYDARIFYSIYFGEVKINEHSLLFWAKWLKYTIIDSFYCIMSRIDKENTRDYTGYRDITVKGCKRKYLPFVGKNTIVVYPEVIYGNLLRAKKVTRYLLYYYKYKDDIDAYSDTDLFIAYRKEFDDEELNPNHYVCLIAFFDLELYKRYNYGERNGRCYVIRKGEKRSDLPKEFDGIVVDDLPEKEKVKVFNECEWCISYDTQTAYSTIAAICGCKSVVVPEEGKSIDDYLNENDERLGVAIGFSEQELKRAADTTQRAIKRYQDIIANSVIETKRFIEYCEKYFDSMARK